VDDLEVAAAAAAAAMDALATHGQSLGESSSSGDDDSDSSDDDEDDSSSEGDAMEVDGAEGAAGRGAATPRVYVSLQPHPARADAVQLSISVAAPPPPAPDGAEAEEDSSPLVSSSSSSSEDDSSDDDDPVEAGSDGGAPLDYAQMRGMIDAAYAAVDAEDEEAVASRGGPKALHEALGLQEGAPSLAFVQLVAGEAKTHVGNVTAVVEDMAVVQGLTNMPALSEGCASAFGAVGMWA